MPAADATPGQILARIAGLEEALRAAEAENRLLREMLRLARIRMFGPAAERLSDLQLELLEAEPSAVKEELDAEADQPPPPKQPKARRRHPGRTPLPAHLPRREEIVPCGPAQCRCGCCGAEKKVIGFEQTEELAVVPAQYYVRVIRREKRACPDHPEDGVATAPAPAKILPKAKASNDLVVEMAVAKYRDHLPLYRQAMALESDAGIELDGQTICGWMMSLGDLLRPVAKAQWAGLLAGGYIQADETPVPVRGPDGYRQGWMWEYGRPKGPVIFEFSTSRGRDGPRELLKKFGGLLQHDDYAGYNGVGGNGVVHLGCWAHSRRKFFEAHQLDKDNAALRGVIETIKGLYAVEDDAREQNLDSPARAALRKERAAPILERLKADVTALRAAALPASKAAEACNYALGNWGLLTRYVDHGIAEIDNNWAENAIRPLALGRNGCTSAARPPVRRSPPSSRYSPPASDSKSTCAPTSSTCSSNSPHGRSTASPS